jgi:hypothetical protein
VTSVGRGRREGSFSTLLQSVHGKCKPYQVRQMLDLIDRYDLRLEGKA